MLIVMTAQEQIEFTHYEIEATITDRWGNVEKVYAGSQPIWAWDQDGCKDWRKMYRKRLLADRTHEPHGWRVTFAVTNMV